MIILILSGKDPLRIIFSKPVLLIEQIKKLAG